MAPPFGQEFPDKGIVAIILGASDWPKIASLKPSEIFARSAKAFQNYLTNDNGLGLDGDRDVLWLFDDGGSTNEIDGKIRQFLRSRSDKEKPRFCDVIFFYTGHGDFTKNNQNYYRVLKSTTDEKSDYTGYQMSQLVQTMNYLERKTRKYVILDCCYAASAFAAWQKQGIDDVSRAIKNEAERNFKEADQQFRSTSGAALVCACDEDKWALYNDKSDYTMFSGGLLHALKHENDDFPDNLSVEHIVDLTRQWIRALDTEEKVEPRLHVAKGRPEDLISVPLFPNPARRAGAMARRLSDLEYQVTSLQSLMNRKVEDEQTLGTRVQELAAQLSSLSSPAELVDDLQGVRRDLDGLKENLQEKAGQPQPKNSSAFNAWDRFNMSAEDWGRCPVHVREDLLQWEESRRNGGNLLGVSVCIALFAVGGGLTIRSPNPPEIPLEFYTLLAWMSIAYTCVLYLAFVGSFPIFKLLYRSISLSANSIDIDDNRKWEANESVIRARKHESILFFGLAISRGYFLASVLAASVGLFVSIFMLPFNSVFVSI